MLNGLCLERLHSAISVIPSNDARRILPLIIGRKSLSPNGFCQFAINCRFCKSLPQFFPRN